MEDATRVDNEWIFSPTLDMWAHLAPIVAGCLLAPFMYAYVPPDSMPLWGYLIVVVFCDVGHVWGTIFRCYLDTEENSRRWGLYNVAPFVIFAAMLFTHYAWSEAYFWMAVGYFALFHFVRQQWGFLCLYRARKGERDGAALDRFVHTVGAVAPMVVWHADPNRSFDWFMREDPFLIRFPQYMQAVAVSVWLLTLVAYAATTVSKAAGGEGVNRGKVMTMAFCWLTWVIGILLPHKLIAVFFLNMFHAAPSYMIVFFTSRNKWRARAPPTQAEHLVKALTAPGSWYLYLAFFVAIALVEEALWEVFVWRDYFPQYIDFEMTRFGTSFFTSLLALPQVVHYFLDAFIWKLDSNPGLSDYYGLSYTTAAKAL
eukprot:TRINITY_DN25645_c0_g1_i1.p1 TRINITY_DN25645_c0_g1~~TRINITY_DN25645_c0_g1_i1.p1  ORF type:complete len:394 (+),score=144.63 TRINITY_DN25645_c0_g1_i1:74-1183(+)